MDHAKKSTNFVPFFSFQVLVNSLWSLNFTSRFVKGLSVNNEVCEKLRAQFNMYLLLLSEDGSFSQCLFGPTIKFDLNSNNKNRDVLGIGSQSINGYICQAKQCNKYTCHIYNKRLDFTLDCAKENFNSNRVVRTKWRMSKVRINDVFGGKVSNLSVMAD